MSNLVPSLPPNPAIKTNELLEEITKQLQKLLIEQHQMNKLLSQLVSTTKNDR